MKEDLAASALALVLDAMLSKINSFKTEEELRAYLKEYLTMPKEERKEKIYKDFKRAIEEVQDMLKKTC
jgi:hypothetical protein